MKHPFIINIISILVTYFTHDKNIMFIKFFIISCMSKTCFVVRQNHMPTYAQWIVNDL